MVFFEAEARKIEKWEIQNPAQISLLEIIEDALQCETHYFNRHFSPQPCFRLNHRNRNGKAR